MGRSEEEGLGKSGLRILEVGAGVVFVIAKWLKFDFISIFAVLITYAFICFVYIWDVYRWFLERYIHVKNKLPIIL